MRLKHRNDATASHDRASSLQGGSNLGRVMSMVIEEADPATLTVELKSTISSTKPTH
jgi:hypothetical protein